MTKTIELTRDQIAIVDDNDFPDVSRDRWHAVWDGWRFYAARNKPRAEGGGKIRMHRQIMGAAPDDEVDHVNGDGLDNRRPNLRLATTSLNQANSGKGAGNRSGFKGVCLRAKWPSGRPRPKPWHAYIRVSGKQRHLGYFRSRKEAARAYDRAALKNFGPFAQTNELMGFL